MKKIKTSYIFERIEKKYLLTEELYYKFLERIEPYMVADSYGLTSICNVYFDTENNDLIRTSIDKPNYKEKLRLRSYGVPDKNDTVFLEIKKKCNGTVFKRRVSMNLKEATQYLNNGEKPKCYSQILNEIDYFINYYKPVPKLFLAYDRIAYAEKKDGSVRITFDKNIRSREYDLELESGDYGKPLIDDSTYLMEIKVSDTMPMWLARALSELAIFPISFSKYGNVYKNKINLINVG